MIDAEQALSKLIDGNRRFIEATSQSGVLATPVDHEKVAGAQSPFAIIIGCSDSRVPAELVFHCGLGDLFVIRVAGNVVAPSQVGSVEYACEHFGTQLLVVMGHSNCGAIQVTVDALLAKDEPVSPNLKTIVERISPAVSQVVEHNQHVSREELNRLTVRANVRHTVRRVTEKSVILRRLVASGRLKIVGADYSLGTGEVTFIDA